MGSEVAYSYIKLRPQGVAGLPDPRSNLAVLGNDVNLSSKLQQLAPRSKPESFPPNLNPTRHTSCPDSRGREGGLVSLSSRDVWNTTEEVIP